MIRSITQYISRENSNAYIYTIYIHLSQATYSRPNQWRQIIFSFKTTPHIQYICRRPYIRNIQRLQISFFSQDKREKKTLLSPCYCANPYIIRGERRVRVQHNRKAKTPDYLLLVSLASKRQKHLKRRYQNYKITIKMSVLWNAILQLQVK